MMRLLLLLIVLTAITSSCSQPKKNEKNNTPANTAANLYAKHFSIAKHEGYTTINIENPWIDAKNIYYRYAIKQKPGTKIPDKYQIIPHKPAKVAAISTTHIAFLEVLNELNRVKAVSDKQYIYSRKFRKLDSIKAVKAVGFDTNLNIEKLLQLGIKVVFLYGISNEIEPLRKRLIRAEIVPVMIGEYMEQHPLGKAEWIKVFGAIFDKTRTARNYFDSVSTVYRRLSGFTDSINRRPSVFTGLPWNDTWHTPGGNTYTAKLINDAGGQYVFHKDTSSINYQYDTEIVYERAGDAGYWINPGTANALKEISGTDPRMKLFKAYKHKKVFNNNRRKLPGGGSDYMESGVVKPHLILKDLIHILHPRLLPDHQLYFYQKLN